MTAIYVNTQLFYGLRSLNNPDPQRRIPRLPSKTTPDSDSSLRAVYKESSRHP